MSKDNLRNCPVCNAKTPLETSPVVTANSPAEDCDDVLLQDRFIGFSNEQVFFSYARCAVCQMLYCPAYFTQTQLDELYESMPDNTAGEELKHLRRTQRGYVRKIERLKGLEGRWLDVGADIGLLGEQIISLEPKAIIDAIEPNVAVHGELSQRLGPGSRISTSWNEVEDVTYDGVVAIHVLDHLIDLGRDLDSVSGHLRSGGIFMAVVHNEQSLLRRILGRKWPPFCLQHPHLFSPVTLRRALETRGFQVESIRRTTNFFTLHHLATVAFSVLGIPKTAAKYVPRILVPLPLGNIEVVARKR